mgnify:CR=1 FL=1
MRRWNGWGDEANKMDLPPTGGEFLSEIVGNSTPLPNADWDAVLKQVPESRLAEHALIDRSADQRIRHARGQSLPDWLAMRSGQFEFFPDGVAFPETKDQVAELVSYCYDNDIILIPYGGGTSVAGHINPFNSDKPILTVAMTRMARLMDFDEESQIATFGAGTPGPLVESQLRAKGYTLGHYPQSFELSTVGGWVASRSSGQQSLRYGRIEQMFAGGSVETPKGRLDIPTIPASAAGPDVREMFMGTEGRMGIISEVKVRVTPFAEQEDFYVIFFPSWDKAKSAAKRLVQSKTQLSMLRLSNAIETVTQLALAAHPGQIAMLEKYLGWRGAADGKCMMTLGVTGNPSQCRAALSLVKRTVRPYGGVYTGAYLGKKWAEKRFMMPYLREALWDKGYVVDTLETATDWSNVDPLLNKMEDSLRQGLSDEDEKVHVFTHLSHFYGQGSSIYTTYVYRAGDNYSQSLERWKKLKTTTSELIVQNGGTISHQHGVGKDHAPYLATEKGPLGMHLIRTLCATMDEKGLLNPGTLLVDPVSNAASDDVS